MPVWFPPASLHGDGLLSPGRACMVDWSHEHVVLGAHHDVDVLNFPGALLPFTNFKGDRETLR